MSIRENLSPYIAEFNGVSLRYNKGPEILKDINFQLKPRTFYFMTGESGAGKTSLLSLLYLHLEPTKGRVRLFGQAIDMMSRGTKAQIRRQIGVVFQDYRLFHHLNAFDNVALPLRLAGERESDIKKHVSELLAWVGLEKQMKWVDDIAVPSRIKYTLSGKTWLDERGDVPDFDNKKPGAADVDNVGDNYIR